MTKPLGWIILVAATKVAQGLAEMTERRQEVTKESVLLDTKRAFPFTVYGRT
jgi:hypothetical protein